MKPASLAATIFIALVAIGHLLRLLFHIDVTVGRIVIPMWMSALACLFLGSLAILLWLECRRK